MRDAAVIAACVAAGVNALVALWGGLLWYRVDPPGRAIWLGVRTAQGASIVHALVVGGLYLGGLDPGDDLYVLYVGLPLAVSYVAEQLRALSAQTVLEARGLEDAAAVGTLEPAAQQSVVTAIVRRELGVMAVACGAAAFLLLRAADTL